MLPACRHLYTGLTGAVRVRVWGSARRPGACPPAGGQSLRQAGDSTQVLSCVHTQRIEKAVLVSDPVIGSINAIKGFKSR